MARRDAETHGESRRITQNKEQNSFYLCKLDWAKGFHRALTFNHCSLFVSTTSGHLSGSKRSNTVMQKPDYLNVMFYVPCT